ncbi:MAG: hypothetical protein AAF724_08890 [Pseudomonadota bacterium]
MEKRFWYVLGLFVLGVTSATLPASGQDLIRDKNWTIVPLGSSCSAVNRPLEEFNASPYNAMVVNASKARGLELQIYFWPGYVASGPIELLLVSENGNRLEVTAEPYGDQAVTVSFSNVEPMRILLEEGTLLLAALKAKPDSLTFEIEPLRRLFRQLEDCSGR